MDIPCKCKLTHLLGIAFRAANVIAVGVQYRPVRLRSVLYTDLLDSSVVQRNLPPTVRMIDERFLVTSLEDFAFVLSSLRNTRRVVAAHTPRTDLGTLRTELRGRLESSGTELTW